MAYKDNSGINLGSNFTYKSNNPLDSRHVPANKTDLEDILETGTYGGMPVYLNGVDGYDVGLYIYNTSTGRLDHVLNQQGELVTPSGVAITSWVQSLIQNLSNGEIKTLQEALAQEVADRAALDTTINKKVDDLETALENAEADLAENISDVSSELTTFKDATSTWQSNHDETYQAHVTAFEDSQAEQNADLVLLKTIVGEDDTHGLQKEAKDARADITDLQTDVEELQEALGELDGNVAEQLELHTKQFAATEPSELLAQLQELSAALTWKTSE